MAYCLLIRTPIFHLTVVRTIKAVWLNLALIGCSALAHAANVNGAYTATAYSVSGTTASGVTTHRHIVAADPDVLPIGSRIKIKHAGRYSGEYVVADTGEKIEGRRLDIYMPSTAACVKFGKKQVRVRVIQLGDGTKKTTKQAEIQVKQDVQTDIAKKAVGNAATEDDWVSKKRTEASTATTGTPKDASASSASTTPAATSSQQPAK